MITEYQKLLYAPSDQTAALRNALANQVAKPSSDAPQQKETVSTGSSPQSETENAASYDRSITPRSTVHYERRGARIHGIRTSTVDGEDANILVPRCDYIFSYKVYFEKPAINVRCGMFIKTTTGYEPDGATTSEIGQGENIIDAGNTIELRFRFRCLLTPGAYFLNAGVVAQVDGVETFIDRCVDAAMFKVKPTRGSLAVGTVDLMIETSMHLQVTSGGFR